MGYGGEVTRGDLQSLEYQIGDLREEVGSVRRDMRKKAGASNVDEIEECISELSGKADDLSAQVEELQIAAEKFVAFLDLLRAGKYAEQFNDLKQFVSLLK